MSVTSVRIGLGAPFALPETRGDPAMGAMPPKRENETKAMRDMTPYARQISPGSGWRDLSACRPITIRCLVQG